MKEILIIGAGDLGKEVVWLIEDINKCCPTYLILGFLDSDREKIGKEFYGYKVLGSLELLDDKYNDSTVGAVIAILDSKARERIVRNHITFKNWETIIHPSAVIAPSTTVGEGSIVFPNVTVSVDTKIGRFDFIYIQSVILNDCRIGDYVSIMANVTVQDHKNIPEKTVVKK